VLPAALQAPLASTGKRGFSVCCQPVKAYQVVFMLLQTAANCRFFLVVSPLMLIFAQLLLTDMLTVKVE
jgi:hypothetical protein